MADVQIEDRPGGAIIAGTRISIDDVLIHLLDPELTEEAIAEIYSLSSVEVAAARAYILNHPDAVLSRHLQIVEKSDDAVNPPEVAQRARQTRSSIMSFKKWREGREAAGEAASGRPPTFREWLAGRGSHQTSES